MLYFGIKNKLVFDAAVFDEMKTIAEKTLKDKEKKQYAQAIVLLTSKGNKYSAFVGNALSKDKKDEKDLLEKLSAKNDTAIDLIFCLWQEGTPDIPSNDFRKMVVDLDSSNLETDIVVMTEKGCSVIKLNKTMK